MSLETTRQAAPAMTVQVQCINKTNRVSPHERIHSIGGLNPNGSRWKLGVDQAIAGIKADQWRFWTTTPQGKSVWVIIAMHEGREYLKTEADGLHPNNLLALPECP